MHLIYKLWYRGSGLYWCRLRVMGPHGYTNKDNKQWCVDMNDEFYIKPKRWTDKYGNLFSIFVNILSFCSLSLWVGITSYLKYKYGRFALYHCE